ncbi:MAG TPA: hypothetical protein PLD84_13640 [Chitinophagales bacterium]|nr:hypothetical protein [Chitinophagales bacterium]
MNPFLIFLLVLGIAVVIFGILTFTGKTPLSKRSFYFSGIELDKSVMGLAFFFLGMLLVIAFLIVVVGPNFRKEGL